MFIIPYIVAYVAILVFAVAVIGRFIMFAKLPMHLRWELYPVGNTTGRCGPIPSLSTLDST